MSLRWVPNEIGGNDPTEGIELRRKMKQCPFEWLLERRFKACVEQCPFEGSREERFGIV